MKQTAIGLSLVMLIIASAMAQDRGTHRQPARRTTTRTRTSPV